MHRLASSFILGYHGCDNEVARQLIDGNQFKPSQNDYDWLGNGIYFWEANPNRGLDFAKELKSRPSGKRIKNPSVVGAIIDLGLCLDLTTSAGVQQVRTAFTRLNQIAEKAEYEMPKNSADLMRRNLDCAVIQLLHAVRTEAGEAPIDTVRGVFLEGNPIYEESGFFEKTHIQICVRNPECIKGVFKVPANQLN
ncbi:MAG: hypothetical protein RIC29_10630 [Rhodospirillaceae bacterium]